jgi:predicted ATPase
MLRKLRFKNFKAWEDSGEIRLAPLTVIFGGNSAGKTSVAQLLLMLKQTAESSDRQRALQLGDGDALVDLGTFEDVVHGHDLQRALQFSLTWELASELKIEGLESKKLKESEKSALFDRVFLGDTIDFSASLRGSDNQQPTVESLRYQLMHGDALALDLSMSAKGDTYEVKSHMLTLSRRVGRPSRVPAPQRFYGFPDEAIALFENIGFAADLAFELERLFGSLFYVGPLRGYPKRLYLWSGEKPSHVGGRGERAIDAILAAKDRAFNWKAKQKTKTLPQLVAERLQKMGLIHSFRVEPIGRNRKEYEVLVRTNAALPEVKLTDVGFGVSQVLPVIVESFYVPARSIVLFEQPEIHLHPRVQADLADLFVDAVGAREHNEPRDCQFIIESHSEHFLRRLQRLIAEEKIAKADTALYFVDSTGGSATMRELELDDYGNIRNWPTDFFGDEMADLVARTAAQARRTKAGK